MSDAIQGGYKELKLQDGFGGYSSPRMSSEVLDCSMPLTFDQYNFCHYKCQYCVIKGTKIAVDGKGEKIQNLKRGDAVYSYNIEKEKIEKDKVISTMEREVNSLLEITLENDKVLHITKEHPVFTTNRGWIKAGDLNKKDDVVYIKTVGSVYNSINNNPMSGKKNPAASKRMSGSKNPMKNKKIAKDVGKKLRKKFESGELDWLKERRSKRAKEDNPLSNKIIAKKVSESLKNRYSSGKHKHPCLGIKRPDVIKRNKSSKNPLKNKSKRKVILKKSIETWIRNGKISKGEILIKKVLSKMNTNFIQQFIIDGSKNRIYFLDFFLPDNKICIEYDGHSSHYTKKGILKDKHRDSFLKKEYNIKTIRIARKEAFIGIKELQNLLKERINNEN